MTDAVSIYLIDPNVLFRQGLGQLLGGSGFEIMAQADRIDVLPADLEMPRLIIADPMGPAGLHAMEALHRRAPHSSIVVLTDRVDATLLSQYLNAGADACLLKDMTAPALVQSLKLVLLGERVFPSTLPMMLRGTQGVNQHRHGLSQREMQILRFLLKGSSNKAIANALSITEATVKVHLKGILRKIGAANRTQAAIWAMNNDIAHADEPVEAAM